MKEQTISKINKMGKAGYIITVILRVFVVLGLIAAIAAAVAVSVLPKDAIRISVTGKADVDVDLASLLGKDRAVSVLKEQDLSEQMETYGQGGELQLEGVSYAIDQIDAEGSHIIMSGTGEMYDFNLKKTVGPLVAALLYLVMTFITLFFIGALFKALKKCQSPFEENVIKKMKMLAYSLIPWVVFSSISDTAANGLFNNRINFSLSVNLDMVFIVLLILALAYIFQYGAVLQQESDETL